MPDTKKDKAKRNENLKALRTVILVVLGIAVALAVYMRISNHSKNSAQDAEENMSEETILMEYDFARQYPKDVREVVKLHCRYLKCLYNEKLEEGDLQKLNEQSRELLAEELLLGNDQKTQEENLKKDIDEFQTTGKIYVSYTVDPEDSITYNEINGRQYATIYVTCNIREGNATKPVQEEYLLVQEEDNWKILGWQGVITSDSTTETE